MCESYVRMSYVDIHCFEILDLVPEVANDALLGLDCLLQLHFLLLNQVPVSLGVLETLLQKLELLLLVGRLLPLDVVLLLILFKCLDLLVLLDQFDLQLLQLLLVLELELGHLSFAFLAQFLGQVLDCLLMLCPELVHLLSLVNELCPELVFKH